MYKMQNFVVNRHISGDLTDFNDIVKDILILTHLQKVLTVAHYV